MLWEQKYYDLHIGLKDCEIPTECAVIVLFLGQLNQNVILKSCTKSLI